MASHFSNLMEAIETHAANMPDNHAFTFYNDPAITYTGLIKGINQVAALLIQNNIKPTDRVLIAIPNSAQFFWAFYGTLRAGGIAVPASPGSSSERIGKLARLCDAAFILTSQEFPNDLTGKTAFESERFSPKYFLKHIDIESRFSIKPHFAQTSVFPTIQPDDTAFIQFTSGSTGDPKGVQISHEKLMINIKQMISGMQITSTDIFVSWLPVFHDMGLILMTMVPLYFGTPFFLLPIGIQYLQNWLETIAHHKATFTAAPDFMYRLTMLYIKNPENYDLSTLRVTLNAAEPVRAATIDRFERSFNLNRVMLPAYGLAEATVGVSCWYPGKPIKVDSRGHVSVGRPFPGIDIKIDDKTDNTGCSFDTPKTGEILVRSPANTHGYFKNSKADKNLFTMDHYIRTGDLGYLDDDGDLTVIGRKKNIIIQGGINISSREVEEIADAFSFVRKSAAAGIDRGKAQGEQVYIFIEGNFSESEWLDPDYLENKKIDMVQAFKHHFGFRPGRIIFMMPRSIPITMNGKTQYTALIKQFLSGSLGG